LSESERLEEYLGALRSQGVRLTVEVVEGEERLKASTPRGGMRQRMVAAIQRLRGKILEHGYWWRDEDGQVTWWGRCAECGQLVQGAGQGLEPPEAGTVVCGWCYAAKRSKRS